MRTQLVHKLALRELGAWILMVFVANSVFFSGSLCEGGHHYHVQLINLPERGI